MTDQLIDVPIVHIEPNPLQPRKDFDTAALNELAGSLLEHGVIEPLIVYANPGAPETYTLLAGERRWRAAQIANLRTVPCVVRPVPDGRQQSLEVALIENVQRADLSVAEEAQAYQQLHDEFGLTDEQIGQRVGKARSTVTNTRNLAKLPVKVQTLIGPASGQLPARYARSLVPVAQAVPEKDLFKAAQQIVKAVSDVDVEGWRPDPEEVIADLVRKLTVEINHNYWELDWPAKPIAATDKEGMLEIPACTGCPFFVEAARSCASRRCYDAKRAAWTALELERVSKKFKIPVVAQGEAFTVIDITWDIQSTIKAWLKKPPEHLRLTGPGDFKVHDWEHRNQLGSSVVFLATTNPAALPKAKSTPAVNTVIPENESESGKAKRQAAEERERSKRREEKAALRRARADVAWLVDNASTLIARRMQISGGVLKFTAKFVAVRTKISTVPVPTVLADWPEMAEINNAVLKDTSDFGLKKCIALTRAIDAVYADNYRMNYSLTRAIGQLDKLAGNVFELPLPKGWEEIPIHHTESNCWHCGKFTSNPDMTQRDRGEGWGTTSVGSGKDGVELKDVYCPDCGKQLRAKVQAESRAKKTSKAKPTAKTASRGKPATKKTAKK